ncbi:MAG: methyltransferase domain-containing protein [Chloroflexota bacterium]|nr:methyltransferase domain-containing protein [Anaerolineae bacterium]
MHDYLIEMLECPVCHSELSWTVTRSLGSRIEEADVRCTTCGAAYPVREGIALFLTPDLPRNDLWEHVDSGLTTYLREHPEVERQLMDVPLADMAPADQFFRALVLEERGMYGQAKTAEQVANAGLYTREYLACSESQFNYVIERLSSSDGPIVDLASGRGALAERLASRLDRSLVVTDFSPRVLRRNRRWLEFLGLYDKVSLLAFDARRTPFKDRAVGTLTTYLGLSNIEEPADLLLELRRIVEGGFLAISHFFPEEDEANAAAIREAGLSPLLFRRSALDHFAAAGWLMELANMCVGESIPTPRSVLLDGAGVDALPVVETVLQWCVLVAS